MHVPNVVFSCAMVPTGDGTLLVYYAGNDTVMNVAATHEDVLVELCRLPPGPDVGRSTAVRG